jgi:hypothetical protein
VSELAGELDARTEDLLRDGRLILDLDLAHQSFT